MKKVKNGSEYSRVLEKHYCMLGSTATRPSTERPTATPAKKKLLVLFKNQDNNLIVTDKATVFPIAPASATLVEGTNIIYVEYADYMRVKKYWLKDYYYYAKFEKYLTKDKSWLQCVNPFTKKGLIQIQREHILSIVKFENGEKYVFFEIKNITAMEALRIACAEVEKKKIIPNKYISPSLRLKITKQNYERELR